MHYPFYPTIGLSTPPRLEEDLRSLPLLLLYGCFGTILYRFHRGEKWDFLASYENGFSCLA